MMENAHLLLSLFNHIHVADAYFFVQAAHPVFFPIQAPACHPPLCFSQLSNVYTTVYSRTLRAVYSTQKFHFVASVLDIKSHQLQRSLTLFKLFFINFGIGNT